MVDSRGWRPGPSGRTRGGECRVGGSASGGGVGLKIGNQAKVKPSKSWSKPVKPNFFPREGRPSPKCIFAKRTQIDKHALSECDGPSFAKALRRAGKK